MKITFDNSMRIAGIGLVPWARLGPERWLPNYAIASLNGWDIDDEKAPRVHALNMTAPHSRLGRLNTQALIDNTEFQNILTQELSGYSLLTYKPVLPGPQLAGIPFIAGDQKLARMLENKVEFRRLMADMDIPFPEYRVYDRSALSATDTTNLLAGRETVILQDEKLSGGKGTFVISDRASLARALTSIEGMRGGNRVVVSERIKPAYERSVQCCVTRYGIFVGPLQKQIIADPLLANVRLAGSDMFCGAEITPDDRLMGVYPEIGQYARQVGKRIQELGYKGIFSLDCLVDDTGAVYVLEINPRITGITPLITMLHRDGQDIPFYLLHILELTDADYTVADAYVDTVGPQGSLLIIHDQSTSPKKITQAVTSGLYDPASLAYVSQSWQLPADTDDTRLLLQQYVPPGLIKAGAREVNIFTHQTVMAEDERLSPYAQQLIAQVRAKVIAASHT